jgi:hypothetical protein
VEIQQTLEMLDIFQARRAADHSVTEKLHQTSFLKARVLLLYNCPNSSSQNTHNSTQKSVPMRESWGMLRT